MRAGLRFGIVTLAAALALGAMSAPALAQEAAPATNAPAESPPAVPPLANTIGPRELQNFSLNGTVTRPAQEAPPAAASPRPSRAATVPGVSGTRAEPAPATGSASRTVRGTAAGPPSVTVTLPPAVTSSETALPAPAPEVAAQPSFQPAAPADLHPADPRRNVIPWLLAIFLLVAAAAYFFWRQRSQSGYAAVAGHEQVVLERATPEPRPTPQRAAQPLQRATPTQAQPRRAPELAPEPQLPAGGVVSRLRMPPQSTAPSGVVSTSLRPWLEIEFTPGRCVVEEDKATIQFDVAVFNSGSAPARDVLIEASMFNAGPTQDNEIGAFFAHPVAKGDRIPAIAPLKRVAMKSTVSLTLDQMRQFEVAGKRIFVPLIGFNALYRWSGGDGQTSASYLVGRDTQSEKLAPLRLDLGPRIFRGLGARQHNIGVRS